MIRLWPGLFVPPLAFITELVVAFAAVPYACQFQRGAALHVLNVATLALVLAMALLAWREYRVAGGTAPDDTADKPTRDRFLAMVGVLVSVTTALALIAQLITLFVIPPCVR